MAGTIRVEQRYLDHDGQRLGLRRHTGGGEHGPVVVLLPAMGTPAAYYHLFAMDLVERGLTTVVADLRGTGASTPPPGRASRYGYPELVSDIPVLLAEVSRSAPGRPLLLAGHSLGGQLAALHLALHRSPAAGLVLIAAGSPYHRLYPGRDGLRVRYGTRLIATTSAVLGWWPGHRLGFGGRQARNVMRDWAQLARTGRFPTLAGVDPNPALAGIRLPVLAVSVEGDTLTPKPSTDGITATLTGADVIHHHYTAAEAGYPLDHFRWTRAAGPLAGRIRAFAATLDRQPGQGW